MPLLHSDHDYDEHGNPIGWNRTKGDLVGLCFVFLVLAAIVGAVVAIVKLLIKVFS